jgi:hypothetical protein
MTGWVLEDGERRFQGWAGTAWGGKEESGSLSVKHRVKKRIVKVPVKKRKLGLEMSVRTCQLNFEVKIGEGNNFIH